MEERLFASYKLNTVSNFRIYHLKNRVLSIFYKPYKRVGSSQRGGFAQLNILRHSSINVISIIIIKNNIFIPYLSKIILYF